MAATLHHVQPCADRKGRRETCALRRAKAGDLREKLGWWQSVPEPTWPAREQRLDWLEHALAEAYDISHGLAQHGALGSHASHASQSAYLSIVAARRRPLLSALHA